MIGFLIASAITSRVKRLAESAARITEGRLDEPLEGTGGRDEITELGAALETMRGALRETFGALSSERDRLSAIFDALDDAVMVVGPDGEVRFSNPAAEQLIGADRRRLAGARCRGFAAPTHAGRPSTTACGSASACTRSARASWRPRARCWPWSAIGPTSFAASSPSASSSPTRRTSCAIRSPGISGAIEVLRAGAKDDPDAREHFLARLSEDAERVSRLTESLLTLARIEAVGEGGRRGARRRGIAIEEAAQAVAPPDGIEVKLEAEPDLVADGDRVLLRQVLIGLLTNAFKNTSAARRRYASRPSSRGGARS